MTNRSKIRLHCRMVCQLSYKELLGERGLVLGSYATNVLYTVTSGNVKSVVCENRSSEKVNIEFARRIFNK